MPRAINPRAFERFYERTFPRGLHVQTDAPLSHMTRKLRTRAVAQDVISPSVDAQAIEVGLRTVVRWEQFASAFTVKRVPIDVFTLRQIFSGQILRPNPYRPLWARENVVTAEEASAAVIRFVRAYLGLSEASPEDMYIPTFYALGPMTDLRFPAATDSPLGNLAFPGINMPKDDIYFIKPVFDNLVGLQFRVLDRAERILKRYAFDKSVAALFSTYDYAEEEERQFGIFNAQRQTPAELEQLKRGINSLRSFLSAWWGLDQGLPQTGPELHPNCEFKMAGPLRRLRIRVQNPNLAAQPKERIFVIDFLHLEPGILYAVKIAPDKLPGTERDTLAVSFTPEGKNTPAIIHHFHPSRGVFVTIAERIMDEKGRTTIPKQFIPRVWDDESNRGVAL